MMLAKGYCRGISVLLKERGVYVFARLTRALNLTEFIPSEVEGFGTGHASGLFSELLMTPAKKRNFGGGKFRFFAGVLGRVY
ncbi:MAG: hypothetical protein KKD11_04010, partial [Candidatus Omnitrophica bacterium]|nr:hypothetical protein [Candidatus Omnitrophota bacterium]